eukprot:833066-Amphidinium_carterae.1
MALHTNNNRSFTFLEACFGSLVQIRFKLLSSHICIEFVLADDEGCGRCCARTVQYQVGYLSSSPHRGRSPSIATSLYTYDSISTCPD